MGIDSGCVAVKQQRRPEEPLPGIQFRTRPFTLENGYLLPKRENFDGGIAAAPSSVYGQGCLASVPMAATLKGILAMTSHAVDIPRWGDLVTGASKPIIDRGYITVPDAPRLGVELKEAVVKEHIRRGGYSEPTPQYYDYILAPLRLGEPYPHLDENGGPVVRQ